MSKVQTQVMPTSSVGDLSQDELRKRMEYNTDLMSQYGGDVRAVQLYGMGANQNTINSANDSLRREALANINPEQELTSSVISATQMTPDQLKQSYSKYYGSGPQASINYGKMDVPSALRSRLVSRLQGASQSGMDKLNRGSTDDYMKIQGMYQSLQDSKVRNEMAKAQQAQADYAAKAAKRDALYSSMFGLGGMAAGGAIGGPAGAAIGGGLGQSLPGLL